MSILENTRMLEEFVVKHTRGSHPVPLKETSYDIEVVSGLAIVKQTRRFRNDEARPIEAVLTFPVSFDAVVTSLECEVAGRKLKGHAQAKLEARKTYEKAIDDGKAAVLHEELLRGLHMVSVANVAPGAEIVVTATYIQPVVAAARHHEFRVPLTIGQIFGELPLQDSDQVAFGGANADVRVAVRSSSGAVYVNSQLPVDGAVTVSLNDVIGIRVEDLQVEPISDIAADGRPLRIDFARLDGASVGATALDVDVMIDTSGSMRKLPAKRIDLAVSKFQIVAEALRRSFSGLSGDDKVRLWEFNDACESHGAAAGSAAGRLLDGIDVRNKGTNLADAVAKVAASRSQANILLVTDGRAGALGTKRVDVQSALSSGARVTVVLVGDDALEVNVGYLAAQSGGRMFVVSGADAGVAVEAALRSMRSPALPTAKIAGDLVVIRREFAGLAVTAEWGRDGGRRVPGAAAFAAHLAMPSLDEKRAAALAAAEGIVSHLTSIVLVDAEGAVVGDLPEQRKVALPDSALGGSAFRSMAMHVAAPASMGFAEQSRSLMASRSKGIILVGSGGGADPAVTMGMPAGGGIGSVWMDMEDEQPVMSPPFIPRGAPSQKAAGGIGRVAAVFSGFDWNAHVVELSSDPLGILPAEVALEIARVASLEAFVKVAKAHKVSASSLAVAVLADVFGDGVRTAQRLSRRLGGGLPDTVFSALKTAFLSSF